MTYLFGIIGAAVGIVAIVLNVFYIRLARRQLANAELESERLSLEVANLRKELSLSDVNKY